MTVALHPRSTRRATGSTRRAPSLTDRRARVAAWRRATVKLHRLAQTRPFVADLLVVGTDRLLDRLLGDTPASGGDR